MSMRREGGRIYSATGPFATTLVTAILSDAILPDCGRRCASCGSSYNDERLLIEIAGALVYGCIESGR